MKKSLIKISTMLLLTILMLSSFIFTSAVAEFVCKSGTSIFKFKYPSIDNGTDVKLLLPII